MGFEKTEDKQPVPDSGFREEIAEETSVVM